MVAGLNKYQISALNVLGIPVWESLANCEQSESEDSVLQEHISPKTKAKPSQENANQNLEKLRQQLSVAQVTTPVDNVRESTSSEEFEDLSPTQFPVFFKDIAQALNELGISTIPAIAIENTIKCSPQRLCIPVSPEALTCVQKRDLWNALVNMVD